jgi:gamma-glutamyltranspeptidase
LTQSLGQPREFHILCRAQVTVPGAAAGWADAVEAWGSGMPLSQVLAPAVALAEAGFPVPLYEGAAAMPPRPAGCV